MQRATGRGHPLPHADEPVAVVAGVRPDAGAVVGDDEADLKKGLISISSPIARALIGKSAGDVAEVQAPGGVRHYEIIAVRYA